MLPTTCSWASRATSGTGATQDYLLDLQAEASIYTSATSSFVLNSQLSSHGGINIHGSIGLDLNALFSSGWNTRSDVFLGNRRSHRCHFASRGVIPLRRSTQAFLRIPSARFPRRGLAPAQVRRAPFPASSNRKAQSMQ